MLIIAYKNDDDDNDNDIHHKTYLKEQKSAWTSVLAYLNRDSDLQQFLEARQANEAHPQQPTPDRTKILIKKESPKATIPTRASNLSAGLDLYALENTLIQGENKGLVRTGICVRVPSGTYGRLASRSGLSINKHIQVGGGVVDEDYTGELKVIIFICTNEIGSFFICCYK